jgi:hypothetical protein
MQMRRWNGGAAMIFVNRVDAGCKLAKKLDAYAGQNNVLVLSIPRGGVPVAFQVASELSAPLDVFVVRRTSGRRSEGLSTRMPRHQAIDGKGTKKWAELNPRPGRL